MKKLTQGLSALLICMTMMTQSCTKTEEQAQNPFLVQQYETPYGTAPFHLIEAAHYEPAMQEGMAAEDQEIADIVASQSAHSAERGSNGEAHRKGWLYARQIPFTPHRRRNGWQYLAYCRTLGRRGL